MMDLNSAVVVVTGAGRGLGAALAISLADLGCKLILCGRNAEALAQVSAAIQTRTGQAADCVVVDLASSDSVKAALAEIHVRQPRVDILINNGAMWLEASEQPHSAAEVTGVIDAALTGTFLLTQGLMPALKASKRPDIVTIGSISGLPNAPLHSVSLPFYAAKHGQLALADGLRQVLKGTPVRSLCVHPPYLEDISPLDPAWQQVPARHKGQQGTNRDVVEAVVFALTRPRHISLSSIVIDTDSGGLFD
ncbi:SDR family NAD(P)-dependent oxidoreductase [Pseudomonas sp. TKO26]|nr:MULTISPECIES: SDR family NAD(P)-dependent oxidoreductase [Pseudomonas]PYY87170.1 SDR family NAD(P)-dependent oxidoreductase [Pseudomonas sp. TKO30]PYY90033.1 SDR family NAD(P)-dependent oxidoreductase [Pseudomonas sp. TKO29]PYY93121.1 SDR family NAD(P)-dependent oxidoreductase [Pseudomonas sp. TKO26]PYZ00251.1 SDR family NAD(P)-dependent oxidoreductase [Pseudomonas sp. TKO14]